MEDRLEIEHRNFSAEGLDGLYTEHPTPSGLAVRCGISREHCDALELEAECLMETGRAAKWGGREFLFNPQSYESMSRRRIESLRKTIEAKRPEWVETIKDAARASSNVYVIVGLAGLDAHPYPAVAIIENLRDRGELDRTNNDEERRR